MSMEELCLKYKSVGDGLNLNDFVDRLCNVIEKDLINNEK